MSRVGRLHQKQWRKARSALGMRRITKPNLPSHGLHATSSAGNLRQCLLDWNPTSGCDLFLQPCLAQTQVS